MDRAVLQEENGFSKKKSCGHIFGIFVGGLCAPFALYDRSESRDSHKILYVFIVISDSFYGDIVFIDTFIEEV